MAKPILKRTSFGLLRTNPKLTTNIKLIADSKDNLFLESFDANQELSKSMYKGFRINPNSSYSFDLYNFYTQIQDTLSPNSAYYVFEEDPGITIRNRYYQQYDFNYAYGFYPKNSKLYSEEFSLFAPIWLERDNIPDYFVIFKMDGPSTVNINDPSVKSLVGATANFDTNPTLDFLVKDSSNFNENYIKKSKIIKSFDLSERSSLGKYIRNHLFDSQFPESSFVASFNKDENSYWNGISYKSGGFCTVGTDMYKDFTLIDKTIIESDDYITNGFKRNSVVCANILNLEFLFDDEDQVDYQFSRYFGLYMSEVELGKFMIDKDRLYRDKDNEITQLPKPTRNVIGHYLNESSQIQENERGIKVYPTIGPSGPFSGRLLNWNEIQNPRFPYVKDTKGNLYSISNVNNWYTSSTTGGTGTSTLVYDTNYLRIKTKQVDWKNFSGVEKPFTFVPSFKTSEVGRPSIAFKILSAPGADDEIRVRYADINDPKDYPYIDNYTLKMDPLLGEGLADGRYFSNKGTVKQIAKSIAQAINNLEDLLGEHQIFSAINNEDQVIVYSRIKSETWNKLKLSLFSKNATFPYDISDEFETVQSVNNYIAAPIAVSSPIIGKFVIVNFTGGNNNANSRAIIERKYIQEFSDSTDEVLVKTNKGYQRVKHSIYLEEPVTVKGSIVEFKNVDTYCVINLLDNKEDFIFSYDNSISLYHPAKNKNGYLSIYPIRDFDFDFHSDEYNKSADSYVSNLFQWYSGIGPSSGSPIFNWSTLGSTSKNFIESVLGPTSPFAINGYQTLIGYQDDLTDFVEPVFNEYDRLKENTITDLALSSRVVPFINKWVYDNEAFDVRENNYRLNTDQAFGYSNFSPSFDQVTRSTKFFTHEWYYLQSYPPYMTFDQKLNSYSYFDENINYSGMPKFPNPNEIIYQGSGGPALYQSDYNSVANQIAGLTGGTGASANLYSVNEDYFLSYFTRETIGGSAIPRDFKYTIFSLGDKNKAAETLFRGAKVEILDRSEFSSVNYNKSTLKYIYNNKYNGYKFSAVLTFGEVGTKINVIKNDKWKTVTVVIQSDLNDALTSYVQNGQTKKFIDRAHLYALENKLELSSGQLQYVDRNLSGRIIDWDDSSGSYFQVIAGPDAFGKLPAFDSELSQNENGTYSNIYVKNSTGTLTYTFQNIFDITSNSFKCLSITGLPGIPSPAPPSFGAYSLGSLVTTFWIGSVTTNQAPLDNSPKQIGGGFGSYIDLSESISFSTIANDINSGDPSIEYVNVGINGEVEYNTFTINLSIPDYPIISTYLKREPLEKTNSDIGEIAPILGYQLGALSRLQLTPITRYRGTYNPKWRDIIKFIDVDDIKSQGLEYLNLQILTDLGYIKDSNLGLIKNLYYAKINPEDAKILKSNSNNSNVDPSRLIYPLIGEINIDKKDFFVFRSNWDPFYYNRYLDRTKNEAVIGTREPVEEKSFFGSKTIAIPAKVNIQTFPKGTATLSELTSVGNINRLDKFLITDEVQLNPNLKQLTIDVYVKNQLSDWLIADGFGSYFDDYIDPNYSFGDIILEDDIKNYIESNIYQRYEVKEIILWEKIWNSEKGVSPLPQIITNLSDSDKILQGYVKSKKYQIKKAKETDLDFKLIYNIQSETKTSIAISVVLEKK